METWRDWLKKQREEMTERIVFGNVGLREQKMTVKEIPLSKVALPWGMQADGNYRREPEAFFNIIGVEIRANREVPAWSQPMLKELGKSVVVIVRTKSKYLIVARQEPGNPANKNYTLIGPTIQASESNLLQKHGGKRPPYAELLDYHKVKFVELPQDGGRFYGKINKYAIITIDSEVAGKITLLPNSKWLNADEIHEAFLQGDVNEHLTQALLLDVLD